MAILTTIDNIPLFSTAQEAFAYAQEAGLIGYHTHRYQGKTGYMGGRTHARSVSRPTNTTTSSNVRVNTNSRASVVNTNQRSTTVNINQRSNTVNTSQRSTAVNIPQPRVNRVRTPGGASSSGGSSGGSGGGGGY